MNIVDIDENLWQFPCQFPLKIMGPSHAPLETVVLSIVQTYVPEFNASHISIKASKTGKYQSLTAMIQLSDKSQVIGIYSDLAKHQQETDHISLVL